ncbi:MAG: hypothetical protein ACRDQF_03990 [Thermocrispum sp.]
MDTASKQPVRPAATGHVTGTATGLQFDSPEAARQFERRALAALRHATCYGLLTSEEASRMAARVSARTAEGLAALGG